MKKTIACIAAAALVLAGAQALPCGVEWSGTTMIAQALSEKGFEYTLLDDGTAEISGYTGKEASLTIPETLGGKKVTSIGVNAFYENTSITSVTFPDSVSAINSNAFCGCEKLKKVTLPSKLETLDTFAFQNCTALESISIPATVGRIGDYAFMGCTSLKAVNMKKGLAEIGDGSFWGCTSLDSVYIPNTVTYIGSSCFFDCTSLKDATISGGVERIGGSSFSCCGLEEVVINKGVKEIGPFTFDLCQDLTTVTIPKTVTSIDEDAFYGCSKFSTVKGYKGSYAEEYAKENGLKFIPIEEDGGRTPGDVNDDDVVDIKDVTILKQYLAKWNVMINTENADVDGDREVTIKDLTILKQYLAKWKVELK